MARRRNDKWRQWKITENGKYHCRPAETKAQCWCHLRRMKELVYFWNWERRQTNISCFKYVRKSDRNVTILRLSTEFELWFLPMAPMAPELSKLQTLRGKWRHQSVTGNSPSIYLRSRDFNTKCLLLFPDLNEKRNWFTHFINTSIKFHENSYGSRVSVCRFS
jgi:hypothetical protein